MNRYLLFFLFLILLGCSNNNQEDYFSNFDCQWDNTNFSSFSTSPECELENISYQNEIASIIESKCIGCHAQSGVNHGVNLSSYNSLLNYDICFQIDNNLMPPTGMVPLTECEKLQFKNWIDNGLVE